MSRRRIGHNTTDRRHVFPQFVALTTLVLVTSLAVGIAVRRMGAPTQPVGLMKVDVSRAAGGLPGFEHRIVPGVEPTSFLPTLPIHAMPTPLPSRAPQPAPEAAVVEGTTPGPVAEVVRPADATPTFNGRPIRKVRTIPMLVTAYSPDERSCPGTADGITASGYSVWTNDMKLVAADTDLLPFNSIVTVPGYNAGQPVPVLDRGGAIKGRRLDVLYPTHEVAQRWGSQRLEVTVWEYAD